MTKSNRSTTIGFLVSRTCLINAMGDVTENAEVPQALFIECAHRNGPPRHRGPASAPAFTYATTRSVSPSRPPIQPAMACPVSSGESSWT